MSVSLSSIAIWKGVDQRTVRRWCAKGIVPGASRTDGGHWRIADSQDFHSWLADASLPLRRHKRGKGVVRAHREKHGTPIDAAVDLELLTRRLARSDIEDRDFVDRDPELRRDLTETPIWDFLSARARSMAGDDPKTARVAMAANELLRDESRLNARTLAEKSGISRAGLYRHYPGFQRMLDAMRDQRNARTAGRD